MAAKEPMIGVDTNVLVRFLVEGDNPDQQKLASSVFASGSVAIAHTVLLETEWVLRESFRFRRVEIVAAFLRLLGLPTVICERKESVIGAIRAFENGCDFADAFHVAASAGDVAEFVTFDRQFASRAEAQSLVTRVRLLAASSPN
jgi:predicted nucleic-acid-binding protein